jgi:hypothetical protein
MRLLHYYDTWNYRRYVGWWVLMALAIGMFASISWAGNVLKLGALLANPEAYQLKVVRVEGTVANHQFKHYKRWANNAEKCVQSFTVTDETGTMQAAYAASCSGALDLVRNRDRVTMDARFEWKPGKSATLNVQEVLAKMAP